MPPNNNHAVKGPSYILSAQRVAFHYRNSGVRAFVPNEGQDGFCVCAVQKMLPQKRDDRKDRRLPNIKVLQKKRADKPRRQHQPKTVLRGQCPVLQIENRRNGCQNLFHT